MTEQVKNANEIQSVESTSVETSHKRVRRGISSARGTTRLKFTNDQAKSNGLFIGHLESVSVDKISIGEDKTGMPSFNGLEIPRISFLFASNEDEANKRHYVTLNFNAVESTALTIPGAKEEWKVNNVLDWFKHILDVYVLKGRNLTEEEDEALSLDFEDFDDKGDYVPVEPEVVIAAWTKLFENIANILNHGKEEGSYYKTKDGKFISIWMKLIRFYKNTKTNEWKANSNGDLSFPTYVKEGILEIFKQNTLPSIHLNPISETIRVMEINKPKAPTAIGVTPMGAPAMGGVNLAGMNPMSGMDNLNDIQTAAQEDMPF